MNPASTGILPDAAWRRASAALARRSSTLRRFGVAGGGGGAELGPAPALVLDLVLPAEEEPEPKKACIVPFSSGIGRGGEQ